MHRMKLYPAKTDHLIPHPHGLPAAPYMGRSAIKRNTFLHAQPLTLPGLGIVPGSNQHLPGSGPCLLGKRENYTTTISIRHSAACIAHFAHSQRGKTGRPKPAPSRSGHLWKPRQRQSLLRIKDLSLRCRSATLHISRQLPADLPPLIPCGAVQQRHHPGHITCFHLIHLLSGNTLLFYVINIERQGTSKTFSRSPLPSHLAQIPFRFKGKNHPSLPLAFSPRRIIII